MNSENKCKEYSEYAYKLSNQIDEIHEFARDKLQNSADKMLREYNAKLNVKVYEEGDAVWLHVPYFGKASPKLQRHWTGPYIVTRRVNDVVYQIKKTSKCKAKTIHHNVLKPYNGNNKPTWFHK